MDTKKILEAAKANMVHPEPQPKTNRELLNEIIGAHAPRVRKAMDDAQKWKQTSIQALDRAAIMCCMFEHEWYCHHDPDTEGPRSGRQVEWEKLSTEYFAVLKHEIDKAIDVPHQILVKTHVKQYTDRGGWVPTPCLMVTRAVIIEDETKREALVDMLETMAAVDDVHGMEHGLKHR